VPKRASRGMFSDPLGMLLTKRRLDTMIIAKDKPNLDKFVDQQLYVLTHAPHGLSGHRQCIRIEVLVAYPYPKVKEFIPHLFVFAVEVALEIIHKPGELSVKTGSVP